MLAHVAVGGSQPCAGEGVPEGEVVALLAPEADQLVDAADRHERHRVVVLEQAGHQVAEVWRHLLEIAGEQRAALLGLIGVGLLLGSRRRRYEGAHSA